MNPVETSISPKQRRILLDHLTVVDATPRDLAEAAHVTGCAGICLFMESMPVLQRMPEFSLVTDRPARRELQGRLALHDLSLELVYPFTLTGRSQIADFVAALDCAADLGARRVNLLVYDREQSRREDSFAAFCALAGEFGLEVAVEFFPASQVRTLAEALELVAPLGAPPLATINVDLLHLMRSGGSIAELASVPAIGFGQIADGPMRIDDALKAHEASAQRALVGEGEFDVAAFVAALGEDCPISVEIPQESAIVSGLELIERARLAVDSVKQVIAVA